ncbi:cytochrome c oxidase assembly protein [Amnibacterium flavum]|nr:cytochrome c oxidase assembly protein [Amnibacterium flavum]
MGLIPVLAAAAVIAAFAAVTPFEPEVLDSGGLMVTLGSPLVKVLLNLSMATTTGALILATFVLPAGPGRSRALDVAAVTSGAAAVLCALGAVLSFMSLAGEFSPDVFLPALGQFLTTIELGQAWTFTFLASSALTVLCFVARGPWPVAVTAVFALASFVPLALQGHAAGAGSHNSASSALWLHMTGAGIWIGGLVILALLWARGDLGSPSKSAPVLERYSTVALYCFVIVAVSGTIGAALRFDSVDEVFTTPYGWLVLVKVALLIALGAAGVAHRRRSIRRVREGSSGAFWRIVAAELALMAVAAGVASVLARTPTPVQEALAVTPAQRLTGQELPAFPEASNLLLSVTPDPVWLLVVVLGAGTYLVGVRRLSGRGDRWPLGRTISWMAGLGVLLYATNGGVGLYGTYLFSAHMASHMLLGMVAPILLVAGAPTTLALRTITARKDGSRGVREWLLALIQSPVARVFTHPVVAAALFGTSLIAFYFTPLLGWAVDDPVGHQWMVAHFLLTGYLFALTLFGADPLPYRAPYPLRLLILLATMAFHAFFGLAIITSGALLLPEWYGVIATGWDIDPLDDQRVAGGIAWGIGELPALAIALLIAVQWSRSDKREARRVDRHADRTGDAELREYNELLERIGKKRGL